MKTSSSLSHLETLPGAAILKLGQCLSPCLVPVQSRTLQLRPDRLQTSVDSGLRTALCWAAACLPAASLPFLELFFASVCPSPGFLGNYWLLSKVLLLCPEFLSGAFYLNTSVHCLRLDRAGHSAQAQSRSSYFTLWSLLGLCCKSFWGPALWEQLFLGPCLFCFGFILSLQKHIF